MFPRIVRRMLSTVSITEGLDPILQEASSYKIKVADIPLFVYKWKEKERNNYWEKRLECKDWEKRLELERKDWEWEKKLENSLNNLKWKFSFVTQRFVYELFLLAFWKLICQTMPWNRIFNEFPTQKIPSKTMLDKACRHEEAKPFIRQLLPKGCDASIPTIPQRLLYGTLSEEVHRPDVQNVFVLSDETPEYREFFKSLCLFFDLRFEEIDAGSARNPEFNL